MHNTSTLSFIHVLKSAIAGTILLLSLPATGQIIMPAYERHHIIPEEQMQFNILERDSIMVSDTVSLFDPETYQETVRIVQSKISWKDYCMFRLGINQPEQLLNGTPLEITDPRTFLQLTVQWNSSAGKLDTIRQH